VQIARRPPFPVRALGSGRLRLEGPTRLTRQFPYWLNLSLFAAQERQTRNRAIRHRTG
jgi:hypothetical protein